MERRELLKSGLIGGAVFLGERLAEAAVVQAKSSKGRFFLGAVGGSDFNNWRLTLAAVGTRAQGFAKDPLANEEADGSLVMSGRLKRDRLTLTVYAIIDAKQEAPIGTLTARLSRASMVGTLRLQDGRESSFSAPQLRKDPVRTAEFAGSYRGQVVEGAQRFKALVKLKSNGTFELSEILTPAGKPVAGRLAGVYVLPERESESDTVFAMLYPRSSDSRVVAGNLGSCLCCEDETVSQQVRNALYQSWALVSSEPATTLQSGPFFATAEPA